MLKYSLVLLLGFFTLSACDNQPKNTYRPAPAIGGQEQSGGDAQMIMPEQQAAPATQAAPANSSALNPEHGQPGHRCDIAVGAPLNSSPAPAQEITTQLNTAQPQTAAPAVTAPAEKPNTAGKRLNPEHGQPGHDCAVAVGSPLP